MHVLQSGEICEIWIQFHNKQFFVNHSLLKTADSLLYNLLSTFSYHLKMIILHSHNIGNLNQTKMIDALCQLGSDQHQVID